MRPIEEIVAELARDAAELKPEARVHHLVGSVTAEELLSVCGTVTEAQRERDKARDTNRRLNRRCQIYEHALAEFRPMDASGKPRGSLMSRAQLNAYVSTLRAEIEGLTEQLRVSEQAAEDMRLALDPSDINKRRVQRRLAKRMHELGALRAEVRRLQAVLEETRHETR